MTSKQPFRSNLCSFGVIIVLVLLLTSAGFAEQPKMIKGPVVITSQKLTADNQAHTAVFENAVIARTNDMTIWADRMTVAYNQNTGNVTRIDAQGNVKVLKERRVITSREATYFSDEERVIFTGDPRAAEGENVITGQTMTYLVKQDRFIVGDSKVFITSGKE
jgi:lipopolysaccharide export system protein LptA